MRESWRGWTNLKTPHAAARAREWLGLALLAEGDAERARMELEGAAAGFERMGAALDLRRVLARLAELAGPDARAAQIVTSGRVLGSEQLRALLGDEGWTDLTAWLERTLTRCWHEHGGTTLSAAEGRFTVAFRDLESGLGCAAYVQRSLREHRARHGFAPPMRVALADPSALGGAVDLEALRALAEAQVAGGTQAEVVVVAGEAVASASPGVARLRAAGVPVRVVAR